MRLRAQRRARRGQAAALVLLQALDLVGLHLFCSVCRGRPCRLRPTPAKPDHPEWMAREQDWRRLVRRLQR